MGGLIVSVIPNWVLSVPQLSKKWNCDDPLTISGMESKLLPDRIIVILSPKSDLNISLIYGSFGAGILLSTLNRKYIVCNFFEKLKVRCTKKLFDVFSTTLSTLKTTFESMPGLLLLVVVSSLHENIQTVMKMIKKLMKALLKSRFDTGTLYMIFKQIYKIHSMNSINLLNIIN